MNHDENKTGPGRGLIQEDVLRMCSMAPAWKMLHKQHLGCWEGARLSWESLGKIQAGDWPMQSVWSWPVWGTGRGLAWLECHGQVGAAGLGTTCVMGAASGAPEPPWWAPEMVFTDMCPVWNKHPGCKCLFSYAFSITCQAGISWGKAPKRECFRHPSFNSN